MMQAAPGFSAADARAIRLAVEIGVPAGDVATLIGRPPEPVRRRAVALGAPFAGKRLAATEKARRMSHLVRAIAAATPRPARPEGTAEEAAHRRACAEANRRFARAMIAAGHAPVVKIEGVGP